MLIRSTASTVLEFAGGRTDSAPTFGRSETFLAAPPLAAVSPGVTFSYNLWQGGGSGGPCGPSDVGGLSRPFVSAYGKSGATPDDLHLKCGTPAHDLVTPDSADYGLNYDIDGNPKPGWAPSYSLSARRSPHT